MAKLGDFIKLVSTQINNEDLGKLADLEPLKEVDLDDELFNTTKESISSLMTFDAAKNNAQIQEHIREQIKPAMRRDLLGNIDNEVLALSRDIFGDQVTSELNGIERTNERVKKFGEVIKKTLTEKSGDGKLKDINTGLQNQINELNANHAKEIDKLKSQIQQTENGYKDKIIRTKFDTLMSSYQLGEKYQDDFVKNALIEDVYKKVQNQAKLVLDDNGNVIPKNPQDPNLDIYVNNNKVTDVKEIIDSLVEPYVKKSTPQKPGEGGSQYTPAEPDTKISALAKDLKSRRPAVI